MLVLSTVLLKRETLSIIPMKYRSGYNAKKNLKEITKWYRITLYNNLSMRASGLFDILSKREDFLSSGNDL